MSALVTGPKSTCIMHPSQPTGRTWQVAQSIFIVIYLSFD